jgi:hypothetical protein
LWKEDGSDEVQDGGMGNMYYSHVTIHMVWPGRANEQGSNETKEDIDVNGDLPLIGGVVSQFVCDGMNSHIQHHSP